MTSLLTSCCASLHPDLFLILQRAAIFYCDDVVSIETDVYNASIRKHPGDVFELQLQMKVLFVATESIEHKFTLLSCMWGVGCYNMRDAVHLTDASPCLRNVMPFVKARALDLLSMYDVECEYFTIM
jgi:hypothetical protein